MTGELRQQLRRARDSRVRELIRVAEECAGCGGERDGWTLGCVNCSDRWRGRMRRGVVDPAWFERRQLEHVEMIYQELRMRTMEGRPDGTGGHRHTDTSGYWVSYLHAVGEPVVIETNRRRAARVAA